MARTDVNVKALTSDAGLNLTDATEFATIDATNGNRVVGYGKQKGKGHLVLIINHTTASDKGVTVKAGAYNLDATPGAAFRSKLGDLAVTLTASKLFVIPELETARYEQADQSLWLDWTAGTTGKFAVLWCPDAGN